MAMSREMEARFESNRLKKAENDTNRKRCFWALFILGAIIFGTSFMAGAASAMKDQMHGSAIFYVAFTSGVFQILLGLATALVGWLNYREVRIPGILYIILCLLLALYFGLHLSQSFAAFNIFFLLSGIGLNIWAQVIFHTEDALKDEPGYPLFSPEASQPARYELPKDVIAARAKASQNMDTIGGPPVPSASEMPVPEAPAQPDPYAIRFPEEVRLPEVDASAFGLDAALGTARAPLPVPEITGDVTLEGFSEAEGGVKDKGVDALPQVSAADLLMDMTAAPSHATVKGDVSQLPDPAEVRARMAAMKKAREEHPLS